MSDSQPPPRRRPITLWLLIATLISIPFLPREKEIVIETKEIPVITEKTVIEYEKPPLPSRSVAYSEVPDDWTKLFNEVVVKTELVKTEGDHASVERKQDEAFQVEFKLNLRVPKPNQTLEELSAINESLPKILPGLSALVADAEVSGFYHRLYELKTTRVQNDLTRLRRILSRHNYFDCETILEMKHPETQRHVLLIQSEMDVVTDGSDGDRQPEYDDYMASSTYYQPFTSYGWAKRTNQPNPLLVRWEEKLAKAEKASTISELKREIADLKARSFLIARKDPFVVVSLSMLGYEKKTPFGPQIGDYVAVIYKDMIYPAILGDAGPSFKMGEASLRIAQTLNPKATGYNRPVSDLAVTYLVFPQTRETPFGPPDLAHWHERTRAFLDEIGGLGDGYTLHQWEDLFKKEADEKAAAEAAAAAALEASPEPVMREAAPETRP